MGKQDLSDEPGLAQRPKITMTIDRNIIRRLKELANRNRRAYSVEAEIAIIEHLEREERRQGIRDK